MAKKTAVNKNIIGSWAFLIGVIIAIIVGLVGPVATNQIVISILVILGLIVGFLNITSKEVMNFLIVGAVLVIVSAFGRNVLSIIPAIASVLDAILALVVPAMVVVALKAVFALAKK